MVRIFSNFFPKKYQQICFLLLSLGRIKCTWPNTVGQNFATGVIQWTLVVLVVLGVVLVVIEVVASHHCYYD